MAKVGGRPLGSNLPFDYVPEAEAPSADVAGKVPSYGDGWDGSADDVTLRFQVAYTKGTGAAERVTSLRVGDESEPRLLLTVYADLALGLQLAATDRSGYRPGHLVRRGPPGAPVGHSLRLGDFCLGREVRVGGHAVVLYDADEATLRHLEARPDVFPEADARRVIAKRARRVLGALQRLRSLAAPEPPPSMSLDDFLLTLQAGGGYGEAPLAGLSLQEAVTLFRAFRDSEGGVDLAMTEKALEMHLEMASFFRTAPPDDGQGAAVPHAGPAAVGLGRA